MKQFFSIIAAAVAIVSLVVFGFTWRQADQQKNSLIADLENRSKLLTESLRESVEPQYLSSSTTSLQKVLNKFANRQRLAGLAVYDSKGNPVAISVGLASEIVTTTLVVGLAMDTDKGVGDFISVAENKFYQYALPLRRNDGVEGALMAVQKADYIDTAIKNTWKSNLLRLFAQALIFSLAVALILRWMFLKPIMNIVETIRLARLGKTSADYDRTSRHTFFGPLVKEISKMTNSLLHARTSASEEARLRLEKLDTPWTAERLKEFIKAYLKERKIYVISNREPYSHNKVKGETVCSVPASGMVTAIEPIMEACGGIWMAHGSGDADKETVDAEDKLGVPPDDPKYTMKRVWLTEKEINGFYVGFSNEALWPLCHMAHTRPIFRQEDWQEYRRVNGKFAQNLLREIKNTERPLILVQDFHFALLPQMIKKSRPDAQVGLFWHVPWPNAESFSICPTRKEILEGMLGADVIGFHTQQYCNNFMETVSKEIESVVDMEQFSVTHDGHLSFIKPFPISIAFSGGENSRATEEEKSTVLEELNIKSEYLGLGVDRLDYTKGILERFKGLEFFWDKYPDWQQRFTFVQIAPQSREGVAKYREFNLEVTAEANRINEKFSKHGWRPIILLKKHFSHQELYPLYRQANLCLVTPLHDGMNLVAKEFIAARDDEAGVLILSKFAGASRVLKDALLINPYSAESTAEAIYKALTMPPAEQHRRIKKMRDAVKDYNVYRWSAEFIKAVASLG